MMAKTLIVVKPCSSKTSLATKCVPSFYTNLKTEKNVFCACCLPQSIFSMFTSLPYRRK